MILNQIERRAVSCCLVVAGVIGMGCEREASSPVSASQPATAPASMPSPTSRPAGPSVAMPGFITGKVLTQDGRSIDQTGLKGIRVQVVLRGVSATTFKKIELNVQAKPDGTFQQRLEQGTYRPPTARIEFPFGASTFRLPLMPVLVGPALQESGTGVVQDFVWMLSGPRSSAYNDPTKPDAWFGGSVMAMYHAYRQDLGRSMAPAPAGTKVFFTLTPKTKLADGSEGKVLTMERHYSPAGIAIDQPDLVNIPLAIYTLTAREVLPDGKANSLLLLQPDNTWGESVEGTWEPDLEGAALRPVIVQFARHAGG